MSSFADLGGGVKKSGNYVWDTDTLSWVKMAQPATGIYVDDGLKLDITTGKLVKPLSSTLVMSI